MRVVFVQKFVPHYRLPFFEALKRKLESKGIELVLVYGDPDPFEGEKVKTVSPAWGIGVNSRIVRVFGRYLYWQGAWRHVRKGDLVIVEHAAKLLDNYPLYLMHRLGRIHFGYFGHGENFQSRFELAVSRYVKRVMLSRVSRWFAYTEISRQSLLKQGVDDDIISVVNNSLIAPDLTSLSFEKHNGQLVYIGGMYRDKQLPMILEALQRVKQQWDGPLSAHFIGTGSEQHHVEKAAREHDWIDFHGQVYGAARDQMLAHSEAMLMPGLVGLVAIDSFYFKVPILTSNAGQHSPEVAYLEHRKNALFSEDMSAAKYADLILEFLRDSRLKQELQENCEACRNTYSIDAMSDRFVAGVLAVHKPRQDPALL